MINRVFKTIFILTLCLGITLPANAGSVNVSDGSAFITKSEMAYELNNLSQRMNDLENSLDSKIDKLVSSYLTRNGVWNGAKQTLENYYIVDFIGPGCGSRTASSITNGFRNFQGKTQTYNPTVKTPLVVPNAMNSDYLEHYVDRTTKTIVDKASKSGLIYMTINMAPTAVLWSGSSGNNMRTWVGMKTDFDTTLQSTTDGTLAMWFFEFGVENGRIFGRVNAFQETLVYRALKYDSSTTTYSNTMTQLWAKIVFGQVKLLSFVNKGDRIYCRDYFMFKRNTIYGTLTGGATPDGTEYNGVIMTVDDCSVY